MKILRYYNSAFEAEVVRGRLENEGIRAFVQNTNIMDVLPYLQNTTSYPYVEVAEEDFTRAVAILGEMPEDVKNLKCPECGSKDYKFTFHRKDKELNRFAIFFALILAAITMSTPGRIRRDYHCGHCGTWF